MANQAQLCNRESGSGGEQKWGAFCSNYFLVFFFLQCYINMLKGPLYIVSISNECIWHSKLDVNVKRAIYLFSFKDHNIY